MQSEFVDEAGEQIPVEFEENGLLTRIVQRAISLVN